MWLYESEITKTSMFFHSEVRNFKQNTKKKYRKLQMYCAKDGFVSINQTFNVFLYTI